MYANGGRWPPAGTVLPGPVQCRWATQGVQVQLWAFIVDEGGSKTWLCAWSGRLGGQVDVGITFSRSRAVFLRTVSISVSTVRSLTVLVSAFGCVRGAMGRDGTRRHTRTNRRATTTNSSTRRTRQPTATAIVPAVAFELAAAGATVIVCQRRVMVVDGRLDWASLRPDRSRISNGGSIDDMALDRILCPVTEDRTNRQGPGNIYRTAS